MRDRIPNPVIAVISQILATEYSVDKLRLLMIGAGAPEPEPQGSSKAARCEAWFKHCNNDQSVHPLLVLGQAIENTMEVESVTHGALGEFTGLPVELPRDQIKAQLSKYGLEYVRGGVVRRGGAVTASGTLKELVARHDLRAVQEEFERALVNVESDPPSAATAACALLEAVFTSIIEEENLGLPTDRSIGPLWRVVRDALGLDPKIHADEDLKRILGGLASLVDGIGAFRTHAGSAHGRGKSRYRISGRHARLVVNSSNTLACFVLETRSARKSNPPLTPAKPPS